MGNELCDEFLGARFHDTHARYRRGELSLKEMQRSVWELFPCDERTFRKRASEIGRLRPGVIEFLDRCASRGVPVFIASCGLRPYIEPVLEAHLPKHLQGAIHEIRCNEAVFDPKHLAEFLPPETSADCPYPLDKGAWSSELKAKFPPGTKILGIGNGTSDRSFAGHVTELATTEALTTWCVKNGVAHIPFHDFRDLLQVTALQGDAS